MWWDLVVEGQGGTRVPHQVLSVEEQKRGQRSQRDQLRNIEIICTQTSSTVFC